MKSLIILALLALSQLALAEDASLTGTWLNADKKSTGVTRLLIKQTPNGLTVTTYGKCSPIDCVWGETLLNSASDNSFNFGYVDSRGIKFFDATIVDTKTLELKLTKSSNTGSADAATQIITMYKVASGPNIYIKLP